MTTFNPYFEPTEDLYARTGILLDCSTLYIDEGPFRWTEADCKEFGFDWVKEQRKVVKYDARVKKFRDVLDLA